MKVKHDKKHIVILLIVFAAAFYISKYAYQLMLIQGESMMPAYHSGQLVLLDKRTKVIQAGDVIAFRCERLDAVLVKRVVAVPGDVVQIVDGSLYVNGSPSKSILPDADIRYAGIAQSEIILSEDEYFVLGDNVEKSKDSRYEEVGNVKNIDIIGKVI